MAGRRHQTRPRTRGRLTLIRPDGTEGGMHPLYDGENMIGRGQGPLFDDDAYLSPRHAEFLVGDDGLIVRDLRSLNGVFVKIDQEEELESGDIFRIGQELLRFELISAPAAARGRDRDHGHAQPRLLGPPVGRRRTRRRRLGLPALRRGDRARPRARRHALSRGRLRLGYARAHRAHDSQVFLSDLGSSNGTFLRVRSERHGARAARSC